MMKKVLVKIFLIWSFSLLCNAEDVYSLAIDNRSEDTVVVFEGYRVEVYTNKVLSGEPSPSTKAVYGNINGKSTLSLLKISSNYVDGDSFIVKVYDGDLLVGESSVIVLSGSSLKFDDIITKKEQTEAEKILLMILVNHSSQVNNKVRENKDISSKYMNIPTLLIIESLQNK